MTASVATSSSAGRTHIPSHNIKPGRRRSGVPFTRIVGFILLLAILGQVQAASLRVAGVHPVWGAIAPRQDPLAGSAPSSAPTPSQKDTHSSLTDRPPSQHTPTPTTSLHAALSTSSAAATSAAPQLTALPKAFDSLISNNFSNPACPQFLQGLSNNADFTDCLPFSIIMQSQDFFTDSMDQTLLNDVLDATCNVDLNDCQTIMNNLATQLRSQQTCGKDYQLGNPVAVDAYNGFLSYFPLYQAGCLKTPASSNTADSTTASASEYCYVTAANNESTSLNGYVYSLPLGSPLPPSGEIECTTCLQQTMGFFATAATNATSPLAKLYNATANEVNGKCGASWIKPNIVVNKATVSGASGITTQLGLSFLTAGLVALVVL